MDLLHVLLYIQIALSASCLYRIIRGPSIADRMVAIDIFGIFIDSILYGILYARRGNLVVVWAAHLLGDILGLIFLYNL